MTAMMTAAMNAQMAGCLSPDCVRSAATSARRRLVRPSWRAIVLSVAISGVAHLSALAALVPNDDVQIAGGAPATLAALGNSFADFTQGTTPAQPATAEPSPADPPVTPETAVNPAPQAQPAPAAPSPQPEAMAMAVPDAPGMTAPEAADPVVPLTVDPEAPPPEALAALPGTAAPATPTAQPVTEPARSEPTRTEAAPAETSRSEPAPIEPVTPQVPMAQAAPSTPPEPIAPAPEVTVQQADAATPRPQRRPEPRQEPRQQPTQQPRAQASAASAPQAAGNAEHDARRGSAEGSASASAAASGDSGAAAQAGNAAVSNYPGEVMNRIRRTRQQRVSGRGVAIVSFTIANNGGLAAASVQRSSGSAAIDRAALEHIRRSAPFPAPPAGAGRSYSFEFVVR